MMVCISCGGASFAVLADRLRHDIPRRVVRCRGCELVSLENPQDDVMDYEKEYGEKHGPVIGRQSDPSELFQIYLPYMTDRLARLRHLLDPNAQVLEVGCSTGFFLHAIRPYVARAVGVELNSERGDYARSRGLDVHVGHIETAQLDQHSFDIVFLFQVFEHAINPLEFLSRIRELIAPGGTLYIEVPNVDDALLTAYGVGGYRDFYFRAPHAYYYSASTLRAILAKGGFEGAVGFSQEYSLFNHVNWLQHGSPQSSVAVARGVPPWHRVSGGAETAAELRKWLEKVDRDYRERLEELGVAQNLTFEGHPVST